MKINLLEIDGVQLELNFVKVLSDIYLKVETGKVTGLLGRNGTGKSCLMQVIFGHLEPQNKSIRINGAVQLRLLQTRLLGPTRHVADALAHAGVVHRNVAVGYIQRETR